MTIICIVKTRNLTLSYHFFQVNLTLGLIFGGSLSVLPLKVLRLLPKIHKSNLFWSFHNQVHIVRVHRQRIQDPAEMVVIQPKERQQMELMVPQVLLSLDT